MTHTKEFGDIFIEIWKVELGLYDGNNLHMWRKKRYFMYLTFIRSHPNQLYSVFFVSKISFSHTCFEN